MRVRNSYDSRKRRCRHRNRRCHEYATYYSQTYACKPTTSSILPSQCRLVSSQRVVWHVQSFYKSQLTVGRQLQLRVIRCVLQTPPKLQPTHSSHGPKPLDQLHCEKRDGMFIYLAPAVNDGVIDVYKHDKPYIHGTVIRILGTESLERSTSQQQDARGRVPPRFGKKSTLNFFSPLPGGILRSVRYDTAKSIFLVARILLHLYIPQPLDDCIHSGQQSALIKAPDEGFCGLNVHFVSCIARLCKMERFCGPSHHHDHRK